MRRTPRPTSALLVRLRLTIAREPFPLEHVDLALAEADRTKAEHLKACVLSEAAARWDTSQLEPLLERTKLLEYGRQRVYNAAIGTVARDTAPQKTERALALVNRMRDDGVPPSNYTLQHVFRAARGDGTSVDQLLEILSEQMRHGLRPSRAAFDSLLRAAPTDARPNEAEPSGRVPLLMQVMDACSLRANGETARNLARLTGGSRDMSALLPLVASLPPTKQRALANEGLLLALRARHDDPRAATHTALARGRDATQAELRALLWACADVYAHECSAAVVESIWARGRRLDERTARRVINVAGEGARRGEPGALELLHMMREALFGEGTAHKAAFVQRGGGRRTEAAEHEAVRVLARATWRAGLADASSVREMALSRLDASAVPPRPRLVATCAYLSAAEGDFPSALRLLSTPPALSAEPTARSSSGEEAAQGSPSPAMPESVYLAPVAAVRTPDDIVHAVDALRLMLNAGVAPTLRTRIALVRMAARMQQSTLAPPPFSARAGHITATRLPGASRFWQPMPLPWDALFDALRREDAGGDAARRHTSNEQHATQVAAAADLVLDARSAALLDRIATIVTASSDGDALASLLHDSARQLDRPGS